MIISHRHKFIFIKTRKTAGTSIEMALETLCGPDDVVTPDGPFPKARDVLAARSRNYAGRFNPAPELMMARRAVDVGRIGRDFLKWPKYYNHMRASSVKARTPARVWDGYYKFCFERNSWDKVISFFSYLNRYESGQVDFNAFMRGQGGATADRAFPGDWTRYTLHDRMIVDDVFMFDDLAGGLRTALRKAGVAEDLVAGLELPRLKTEIRDRARTHRFDAEANAVVERVFAREIEAFGFVMPDKFR